MVKVNAPALSLDASGKLANAIVFSKWKGRNVVRELVTPSNPKSGPQIGVRAMFRFLAQEWASLSAQNQASWEDRADQTAISPFNAFMGYNQKRWRNFLGVSEADPATEDDGTPTISNEAATAAERQITVSGDVDSASGAQTCWGVAIFRSTSESFTTAFSNCIAVVPVAPAESFSYVDTPLSPSTYYYNFRPISEVGELGDEETEVNAEVT